MSNQSKKTTKQGSSNLNKTITVKLARGIIACSPDQRACVRGLGLRYREHTSTLENTPAVRGMIKKVLHLVEIVSESR